MKRFFFLYAALLCAFVMSAQPKYVFYFIGDGMGQNQVLATEMYLAELGGAIGRKQLCMTQFPFVGLASTYSASNSITDSSAAGTCLAAGYKTTNGMLGQDPDGKHHHTIAEILHENGWLTGIMTSVSIDHATPGAFYANVPSRNDYYIIGTQLAESGFDFFGGATFYQPNNKDKATDPNLYDLCEGRGYTFIHGYKEFCEKGLDFEKVILIQEHEGLDRNAKGTGKIPFALDRHDGDLTLAQITKSSIDFLSAKGRPFFMMVEGGQIDWACHGNDAAAVVNEVLDFDESIHLAYEFYLKHPDETLIIVTADHETGGMALGNHHYTLNLRYLQHQTSSSAVLSEELKELHKKYGKNLSYDQVKKLFEDKLGLYSKVEVTAEEDAALRATFRMMKKNKASDSKNMYASLNALSYQAMCLLDKKAHIGWTTSSHSASAVPVFAIGRGAELFTGFYDNSDIMPRLLQLTLGK